MPVKMAIIKKVEITSIGEDVEKMCTFSYTVGENGSGPEVRLLHSRV